MAHVSDEHEPDAAGFDRRGFLQRASIVAAGTAWALPTVQSLVTPAFALGSRLPCTACLTGGGQLVTIKGAPVLYKGQTIPKASYGLGQICCQGDGPVEIEVNAHPKANPKDDVSWHFTLNLVVVCIKTGNPAPPPQTEECPNRFEGTARDKLGNKLEFVFVDNGEPGNADYASIKVYDATNVLLLTAQGTVSNGNLQAHPSLGPTKRDCSGCK